MCSHPPNAHVHDQHTGDLICSLCAKVIGIGEMASEFQIKPSKKISAYDTAWADTILLKEMLTDIFSMFNISMPCLTEVAQDIYLKLLQKGGAPPTEILFDKHRKKLAFAVWEALNRNEHPYKPREVAEVCGVVPASLLDVEKKNLFAPTYCSTPTLALSRIKYNCDIPYKISLLLRTIVDVFEEYFYGTTSEVKVAGAALLMAEKLQEEKDIHLKDITVEKICWLLNILPSRVARFVKNLKNEDENANGSRPTAYSELIRLVENYTSPSHLRVPV